MPGNGLLLLKGSGALPHPEIFWQTLWILGDHLSANKPLELRSIEVHNFLEEVI